MIEGIGEEWSSWFVHLPCVGRSDRRAVVVSGGGGVGGGRLHVTFVGRVI